MVMLAQDEHGTRVFWKRATRKRSAIWPGVQDGLGRAALDALDLLVASSEHLRSCKRAVQRVVIQDMGANARWRGVSGDVRTRLRVRPGRWSSTRATQCSKGDLVKRLILTAALGLGLALPAMAQARASLPDSIYFWGSTAVAISVPKGQGPRENTRVIRPSVLYMTFDGS